VLRPGTVDRFLLDITTARLRRSVFTSVPERVAAIDQYFTNHDTDPKPLIWTNGARDVLQCSPPAKP